MIVGSWVGVGCVVSFCGFIDRAGQLVFDRWIGIGPPHVRKRLLFYVEDVPGFSFFGDTQVRLCVGKTYMYNPKYASIPTPRYKHSR